MTLGLSDTDNVQGEQRPTIALMGEFSAGKTTLINFLLGADVLPTRVTATQLPPVWISYGERSAYFVDDEGNETPVEIEDLATIGVDGVRYIRLFADSGILTELDVIDTPGISDPNIPLHFRSFVAETADAILWCTHATQAWRESERSALDSMPKELLKHSVLLATRSDKLAVSERGRVRDRLIRETEGRFANIIMFSAVEAIEACEQESESALWGKSGGEELLKTLHHLSISITDPDSPRMELGMFAPTVTTDTEEDVLVLGAPAAAPASPSTSGGVVLPRRVRRKETSRPLRAEETVEAAEVSAESSPILLDTPVEDSDDTAEPVAQDAPSEVSDASEPARVEPVELTLVLTDSEAADTDDGQADLEALELVEADLAPKAEADKETPESEEEPAEEDAAPVEISEALISSLSERVGAELEEEASETADTSEEIAPVADADAEDDAMAEADAPRTVLEAWQTYREEHEPETLEDLDALVKDFLAQHTTPANDDESDTGEDQEAGWRLYV